MLYIVLGFILLLSIIFATRHIKNLPQEKKKKLKISLLILLFVVVAFLIFRFFGPYLAFIYSAGVIAVPLILKLLRFISFLKFFKNIKTNFANKTSKPSKKTNMTEEEAFEILDLKKGASNKEIKDSYQKLMKKNHPDSGGSKYLASKINAAKDILLKDEKK